MLSEKSKTSLELAHTAIRKHCLAAGRSPDTAFIVAVSKNQPAEKIIPLLEAGHRSFGENRIQEAASKWPALKNIYPDVRLHLIGALQRNKVALALGLFDVIETVDRPELVEALGKQWSNCPAPPVKILVQVNTGREPQKGGVLVENLPALVGLCRNGGLPLTGLMAIPPVDADPQPHFQLLAKLARDFNLCDLSMGMSSDYPLAIAEGASWVRLGKALWNA